MPTLSGSPREEGEKADVVQQQVVMRPWGLWKAKAIGGK